jgi:hypothetical protein
MRITMHTSPMNSRFLHVRTATGQFGVTLRSARAAA